MERGELVRVGLACCRERVILLCLLFAVMFAVSLDFIIDSFALSVVLIALRRLWLLL